MKLVQVYEPIQVNRSPRSILPQSFTWRARSHRVWKIDRVLEQSVERLRGPAKRRVYQIRTHRGLRCSISHDEQRNRWLLETVNAGGGLA